MNTDFENTKHGTEEVKNIVRKASELKSLDELNLSKRTLSRIKTISPESLILMVRNGWFSIDRMRKDSYNELMRAIEEAGFIRHDFDGRSFGLGALYKVVTKNYGNDKIHWPYACRSDFESNEAYENYRNFSEVQLEAVDQLLNELGEEEKNILQISFGLLDGKKMYPAEIAAQCNCPSERVIQAKEKAMRKLRHPLRIMKLKAIMLFSSEEECLNQIARIEQELSELRRTECELEGKIYAIKQYSPFFSEYESPIPAELSQSQSIKALGFSTKTYNILRRAGIATIGDLEKHRSANPEDWYFRIRNMDRSVIREIAEKTHGLLGWEEPLISQF